jgi:hypothetical protein
VATEIQTNPDGTQPPTSSTPRDPILLRYVAAEKIEMVVSKSNYVSQPWIYGNSFFPMLVAVVVPDLVELRAAAVEGGWDWTSAEDLMAKPEAAAFLLKAMVAEGKAGGLKPFELPQKVAIEGNVNQMLQGFSVENDCLTPTFKLKRPQLLKRYQQQIDRMYTELGCNPASSGATPVRTAAPAAAQPQPTSSTAVVAEASAKARGNNGSKSFSNKVAPSPDGACCRGSAWGA